MKLNSVAVFIVFLLIGHANCFAFENPNPIFGNNKDKKKVKPFFQFDNYYSFIGDEKADVFGFKAGVEVNQKWRFGVGYNKIKSDIIEWKVLPEEEKPYWPTGNIVKSQLYLNYYPLLAEYVFYNKDPWQASIPFTVGYGNSYFSYYDVNNNKRKIFDHSILITEIGVTGQVKVFKWIGLGAGVGYRYLLMNNPDIETKVSSPVYTIRIKIFPGALIKTFFPNLSGEW
ncbi:MAG: hypothetical protein ACK44N_05285 [Bacteroidota bacterium]|jgi:hypothetical protein